MEYKKFEETISASRMSRYLNGCSGDTRKAMRLYRENLRLSQQMFTIISCFEISLRNAIDKELTGKLGKDWLRDSVMSGGIFDNSKFDKTGKIIKKAYKGLSSNYTHFKLIAEMEFGIWKYMFSNPQYKATGRCLLNIFPNKPKSTPSAHYDNSFLFNELDNINKLRNRIAHHEPICFQRSTDVVDLTYVTQQYNRIKTLFSWMDIDFKALVYGLDQVNRCCNKIMSI